MPYFLRVLPNSLYLLFTPSKLLWGFLYFAAIYIFFHLRCNILADCTKRCFVLQGPSLNHQKSFLTQLNTGNSSKAGWTLCLPCQLNGSCVTEPRITDGVAAHFTHGAIAWVQQWRLLGWESISSEDTLTNIGVSNSLITISLRSVEYQPEAAYFSGFMYAHYFVTVIIHCGSMAEREDFPTSSHPSCARVLFSPCKINFWRFFLF